MPFRVSLNQSADSMVAVITLKRDPALSISLLWFHYVHGGLHTRPAGP